MSYDQETIETIHKLPLRKTERWIDMSFMFPGKIIEQNKRTDGEAQGKWACVDLGCPDCAAEVVRIHNEWLEDQHADASAQVRTDRREDGP